MNQQTDEQKALAVIAGLIFEMEEVNRAMHQINMADERLLQKVADKSAELTCLAAVGR